jgi:tetratricopeptide (TPR) repeat protein
MEQSSEQRLAANRPLRAAALAAAGLCLLACWSVARAGLARYLVGYEGPAANSELFARATWLSPADPELRNARALWLHGQRQYSEEREELEQVIALRPRDHVAWLRFGDACWANGEEDMALHAYQRAITLAPYYAQPHWKLGNFLRQLKLNSPAFAEIRQAVASDPAKLDDALDAAWQAYAGDSAQVVQAIGPQTPKEKLVVARYLLRQGAYDESVKLWQPLMSELTPTELDELDKLTADLIAAKRFAPAYQVWSALHRPADGAGPNGNLISNGGFEERLAFNETGFGWKLISRDEPLISVAVDPDTPHAGTRSLFVNFDGTARTSIVVLAQLVPVEPDGYYQLSYAVRSRDITTGGPPVIRVRDAADDRVLAEAKPMPKTTDGWQVFSLELTVEETTQTVSVNLERQNCSSGPCPILGRLWLDDLALRKIAAASAPERPNANEQAQPDTRPTP